MSGLMQREADSLNRWTYLPFSFKLLGMGLFTISFIAWFFLEAHTDWRLLAESFVLIGLLLIAVSRGREEDEYTLQLRARAFTYAFIVGVLYSVIQPLVNWGVGTAIGREAADWQMIPTFAVLWLMLYPKRSGLGKLTRSPCACQQGAKRRRSRSFGAPSARGAT
ncbi:MAG: hypothetical protein AAGH79_14920 [Bacteroidota bacterium]